MMRRGLLALPIATLAFVTIVDALQESDIRGATIALARRAAAAQTVTIENLRQSPLLAWAIRISGAPGTGSTVTGSDFTWQIAPAGPDSGPIASGKQRVVEVPLTPGTTSSLPPTLELAVFADGFTDGTPAAIARWRNERREHVEDAAYWRDAFAKM